MKSIALFAIMIFLVSSSYSQTRVVHGDLTVFNTYPVKNVVVQSRKAKSTTMTDSLGQFAIVCLENDIIKIKAKTFKSVKRKVGSETELLSINLQFIDSEANRELAVGYGYMNREDLNYGVSHLQQDNHEFCSYANIFELVRGQLPGVTVNGNDLYIRGGKNSFVSGATKALYVVDNQATASIDWIQPCQIKSINVLKDSNAAIYGTRGSNGVVLIETMK